MSASPELERLIAYLNACGGMDRFESYDSNGQPDPVAARVTAERLRAQLGVNLDVIASVEQSANRVTVTLLVEHAAV
ncbi:MAG TPA: hypothetical protein VHX44_19430 [Planctomycetota bacterium]|jgi:hypothetical protein|nr:hypothetical protein [Planctomycetota bacterium]